MHTTNYTGKSGFLQKLWANRGGGLPPPPSPLIRHWSDYAAKTMIDVVMCHINKWSPAWSASDSAVPAHGRLVQDALLDVHVPSHACRRMSYICYSLSCDLKLARKCAGLRGGDLLCYTPFRRPVLWSAEPAIHAHPRCPTASGPLIRDLSCPNNKNETERKHFWNRSKTGFVSVSFRCVDSFMPTKRVVENRRRFTESKISKRN